MSRPEDFQAANELLSGLRTDVERMTKESLKLIDDVLVNSAEEVSVGDSKEKLKRHREQIERELEKLDAMELRLVIAAPMSAGKSTILDAIIAEELLPHRNAAMTVFPTEICLEPEATETVLRFAPEFREMIERMVAELKVKEVDEAMRQMLAGENPQLLKALDSLQGDIFTIPAKVRTERAIYRALEYVNDIARISSMLTGGQVDIDSTFSPRIIAPYPASLADARKGNDGKLIIVDTPGPNEGRMTQLYDVLSHELERGTMILLVLDYTQLNTGAAARLRERIESVRATVPPENLFIVVNKVDQRKRGEDLSKEEIKEMIGAKLGFNDVDLESRLFEVSAERALAAAKVFRQLDGVWSKAPIDLDDPSIAQLFKLRMPVEWEDELEELKKGSAEEIRDEITKGARRLWRRSDFERFLSSVIGQTLERTGHEILKGAIYSSVQALDVISDSAQLQLGGLRESVEKLNSELRSLHGEKEYLLQAEVRLQELARQKVEEFQRIITRDRGRWREDIRARITAGFRSLENSEQGDTSSLAILLRSLSEDWHKDGHLLFYNHEIAQFVSNRVADYTNGLIKDAVFLLGLQLEDCLLALYEEVENIIDDEIRPVLLRAQTRLDEAFDIELVTPRVSLDTYDARSVTTWVRVEQDDRYYINARVERSVEQLGNLSEKVGRGEAKVNYHGVIRSPRTYSIPLSSLRAQALHNIDLALVIFEKSLREHLEDDFRDSLNSYVAQVNRRLSGYESLIENLIEKAIKEQQKSVEEKDNIKRQLRVTVERVTKLRRAMMGHWEVIQAETVEVM